MISSIFPPSARLPILLAAGLILGLGLFHGVSLGLGSLHHGDEFLTLDRAHSFTIRQDWFTVYSANLPSFKKPPLQYWMTAWLLIAGRETELAARLPAFVFGLLLLANTGLLAWLLLPKQRWVGPLAVLFLACSTRFWESASSALLDMGAAFFCTAALTGTLLARRDPRWWYAVALACGLGAWQKAPVPILFAVFGALGPLLTADKGEGRMAAFANRHFLWAMAVTAVLVAAWPALQWLRYGAASLNEAVMDQMVNRFSPFGTVWERKFSLTSLLMAGEPLLRAPALLALLALPWRLRRPELRGLPLMIVLYALAAQVSTGVVSPRYSLLFLPLMLAALAALVLTLFSRRSTRVIAIGVICTVGLGPLKTPAMLGLLAPGYDAYIPFLQTIAASRQPYETLIICEARQADGGIPTGAISVYASAGLPYVTLRDADQISRMLASGALRPPYRGLSNAAIFDRLRLMQPGLIEKDRFRGLVHWQSPPPPYDTQG